MCISGTVSKFCCHWVLCQISVFSGLCVHILCHLEFHVRRCLVVCFVSFSAPVAIIPWTTGQNNSLFAIMAYLHTYSRVHHILSFNLFFRVCSCDWVFLSWFLSVGWRRKVLVCKWAGRNPETSDFGSARAVRFKDFSPFCTSWVGGGFSGPWCVCMFVWGCVCVCGECVCGKGGHMGVWVREKVGHTSVRQ